MGDYRKLAVWRKSHEVALRVYRETEAFPTVERYGLAAQTRRAAASVPMNLAEGCGRNSDGELARFCRIALGSANELEYQLLLARDLRYLPVESFDEITAEVQQLKRMLSSLSLRAAPSGRARLNMSRFQPDPPE
jgi:four helix bundle protein